MRRGLRVLAPTATYSLLSDGAVLPAFGIEGGEAAAPVASWVIRDGRRLDFPTPGKVGGFKLRCGDVLVLQSAGGGGYGDPLDRPAAAVAEDVREGYISAAEARARYGVALDRAGRPAKTATAALRRKLRAQRFERVIVASAAPLYDAGQVSQRRICPLHPADAKRAGLRRNDIVELAGPHAAPLRAWVRLDRKVAPGTVALDAYGLAALHLAPGGRLRIRKLAPA